MVETVRAAVSRTIREALSESFRILASPFGETRTRFWAAEGSERIKNRAIRAVFFTMRERAVVDMG